MLCTNTHHDRSGTGEYLVNVLLVFRDLLINRYYCKSTAALVYDARVKTILKQLHIKEEVEKKSKF